MVRSSLLFLPYLSTSKNRPKLTINQLFRLSHPPEAPQTHNLRLRHLRALHFPQSELGRNLPCRYEHYDLSVLPNDPFLRKLPNGGPRHLARLSSGVELPCSGIGSWRRLQGIFQAKDLETGPWLGSYSTGRGSVRAARGTLEALDVLQKDMVVYRGCFIFLSSVYSGSRLGLLLKCRVD